MKQQTVDIISSITEIINQLSLDKQQQLLDYAQFLLEQQKKKNNPPPTPTRRGRIAGLHQGKGWISDDFNEPLTEEELTQLT